VSLLDAVTAAARRAADHRAQSTSRDDLERLARERRRRGPTFRESLSEPGIRIIAECKRRSPSRGILRQSYDPVAIARDYASAGAAAISVLTEPTFFDGSLDHLHSVRQAVTVPLLRKDFIVTPFQVLEAAAAGADAVLLIVSALDQESLMSLHDTARAWGLDALVEVHDADELARALDAGATIVGVNSRNLRTLEVSVDLLDELGPKMPEGVLAVAESGLRTAADLSRLRAAGYDAFLIGERFMADPEPGQAVRALIAGAETPQ
jgi:indole-3-glycerol phosphate synthase